MSEFPAGLLEAKRVNPGDDLLSSLVANGFSRRTERR